MTQANKELFRKIGATIFAGYFLYSFGWQAIHNPTSILVHPVPEFMVQTITGWMLTLLLPITAAYLMYRNKRSGIILVRIFAVLSLLVSIPELFDPGFVASEPLTEQEKADSITRAIIIVCVMWFSLFATFVGKAKANLGEPQ